MNVKVIKNNGILKVNDILTWNNNSGLYEYNVTEEDHGENVHSSSSTSYKISEKGVTDNPDYFVFVTEDGTEIKPEKEEDDEELIRHEKQYTYCNDSVEINKDKEEEEIDNLKKQIEDLKKRIDSVPIAYNYLPYFGRRTFGSGFFDFYNPFYSIYF